MLWKHGDTREPGSRYWRSIFSFMSFFACPKKDPKRTSPVMRSKILYSVFEMYFSIFDFRFSIFVFLPGCAREGKRYALIFSTRTVSKNCHSATVERSETVEEPPTLWLWICRICLQTKSTTPFNPPSHSLRTLTIKLQRQRADEKSGLIPRCFASKTRVQGSTLGFNTIYSGVSNKEEMKLIVLENCFVFQWSNGLFIAL